MRKRHEPRVSTVRLRRNAYKRDIDMMQQRNGGLDDV